MVSPEAKLGAGVRIAAYAVVGAGVELGDGCELYEHAVVRGPSKFGSGNIFHPFCVIGGDPQDYTFRGERVELSVGNENIFREFVTVSRGTTKGGGITRIGDTEFFSRLFPRGARLPDRQQHAVRERRDAGRARDRGGLCDSGRVFAGASVLPPGALRLHRRLHRDHAGCAAVFADRHRAGDALLRPEHHRPGAPRLFHRAHQGIARSVSPADAVKEKYFAGPGRDARNAGRIPTT